MQYCSIIKAFVEKARSHEVKILRVPSPDRGRKLEYSDYETSGYYRRWLESGVDREGYLKHQEGGFPLFKENRRLAK